MKRFVNYFCWAIVVSMFFCVGSVQAQWWIGLGPDDDGEWGNRWNWRNLTVPTENTEAVIRFQTDSPTDAFARSITVDVNQPSEAKELFVNFNFGREVTLNVNNTSLIVGRNSFGASMFVGRQNTVSETIININGSDGLLYVGDPNATDPLLGRQQIHAFPGESIWNLSGGAEVIASTFRTQGSKPLNFTIEDDSTLRLGYLFSASPIATYDIIGPDAEFIIDFLGDGAIPAEIQLPQLQSWLTNGNNNTTFLAGGTRLRGYEADGVTQTTLYMLPLDGADFNNGVVFTTVPEPNTLAVLGLGLFGLATAWRRRS